MRQGLLYQIHIQLVQQHRPGPVVLYGFTDIEKSFLQVIPAFINEKLQMPPWNAEHLIIVQMRINLGRNSTFC